MKVSSLIFSLLVSVGTLSTFANAAEVPAAANMSMMTAGEVRKIDLTANKVTIKHGPIVHLDMPGMTMVFTVKDKASMEKLKVGDKIRFVVSREDGKMQVSDIQQDS